MAELPTGNAAGALARLKAVVAEAEESLRVY
jgi:hypothetical protein